MGTNKKDDLAESSVLFLIYDTFYYTKQSLTLSHHQNNLFPISHYESLYLERNSSNVKYAANSYQ